MKKKIDNSGKGSTMVKRFIFLSGIIVTALNLIACGNNNEAAKSMEQLYKEDGVPVKTKQVEPRLFEKKLSYNAVLTGIEESSVSADLTDRVDRVLVNIGDYVKKDQVLITFPTDNPAAQYQQAKVAYDNAKSSYERIKNLYNTGGISQQNYDNAKTQYEVAKANYDAVSQKVRVLAPIDGYVTQLNVVESENVKRDEELATVSKTNKLKAKVWVSEKEIDMVKPGLTAMAIWNNDVLNGKVVQVDLGINPKHQAFGAVLEFENNGNALYVGVTADISIVIYKNPNAIQTEIKNILNGPEGSYVYLAENGQAKKQFIKEGMRENLMVEIIDGLKSGDQLIVEGQMLLEPNSKVNIVE
ncbi:MAG: efflux RND transporter periplasmic adaptor subunit [Calditrichaceae bacterium]